MSSLLNVFLFKIKNFFQRIFNFIFNIKKENHGSKHSFSNEGNFNILNNFDKAVEIFNNTENEQQIIKEKGKLLNSSINDFHRSGSLSIDNVNKNGDIDKYSKINNNNRIEFIDNFWKNNIKNEKISEFFKHIYNQNYALRLIHPLMFSDDYTISSKEFFEKGYNYQYDNSIHNHEYYIRKKSDNDYELEIKSCYCICQCDKFPFGKVANTHTKLIYNIKYDQEKDMISVNCVYKKLDINIIEEEEVSKLGVKLDELKILLEKLHCVSSGNPYNVNIGVSKKSSTSVEPSVVVDGQLSTSVEPSVEPSVVVDGQLSTSVQQSEIKKEPNFSTLNDMVKNNKDIHSR